VIANIGAHPTTFFCGVLVFLCVVFAKVVAVVNLSCCVEFGLGDDIPNVKVASSPVNADPILQFAPPGTERFVQIGSQSQNSDSITRETQNTYVVKMPEVNRKKNWSPSLMGMMVTANGSIAQKCHL
jgi:hypothetical protein